MRLPAKLTRPAGDARVPGVVLVHGSGPHDLDESIGGAKPFRDLAYGLSTRGIAVLRYTKRTKLTADGINTIEEETLADARSAMKLLLADPHVDASRIYVAGHSLGGVAAPLILEQMPELRGAILIAAPFTPLHRVLPDQYRRLSSVDGVVTEEEKSSITRAEQFAAAVDEKRLEPGSMHFGGPASYWIDLASRDYAGAAKRATRPLLLIGGERDFQVPPSELAQWRRLLEGRPNVTIVELPRLNHLMVAGEGEPNVSEYAIPANVGVEVIDTIDRWMTGAGR